MVRGIDIQNIIANVPYANREQQIAQAQANFAAAMDAQKAQKDEDVKKEQVRESRETDQEHVVIDANRRESLIRRRRRQRRARNEADQREELQPRNEEDRGHLIDVEA